MNEQCTPAESVRRFFRREPLPGVPCFSGMGMVTKQAVDLAGIRFPEIHLTAENMAKSGLASAEMYGFDSVVVPYDMCTVAEALGRGVSLYEDSSDILYPTIPHKWQSLEEIRIPGDYLSRGRMAVVDGALKILKERAADNRAVGGWVLGPFTLAGQILELDVLLKGLKKDQMKIDALLSELTDLTIDLARHYQSLGVDYITVREMGSGTDLLSPRMWKALIGPNLQRVFAALQSPKVLHICGSTDMIIEMMDGVGADALSVDQKNTMPRSREKIDPQTLLLGNFDPYGTLCQMEAGEVEGVISQCIADGADAVWPGCDLWPDVLPQNVEAYVSAVRKHGRKG